MWWGGVLTIGDAKMQATIVDGQRIRHSCYDGIKSTDFEAARFEFGTRSFGQSEGGTSTT